MALVLLVLQPRGCALITHSYVLTAAVIGKKVKEILACHFGAARIHFYKFLIGNSPQTECLFAPFLFIDEPIRQNVIQNTHCVCSIATTNGCS